MNRKLLRAIREFVEVERRRAVATENRARETEPRSEAVADHACESVTSPDGHGAYCRICGEVAS